MSYQIKSTPFFQRILSKSRRSGELQRLKDEYERIKDFNDHTIGLRIRQVRLRRLFREIQDINATSSIQTRVRRRLQKSLTQQRAETLSRARELGTEFSRENALNVQRYGPFPTRSIISFRGRKEHLEIQASSTAKRNNYGNHISEFNMRKFKQHRRRTNATSTNELRSMSSLEMDKMEKLRVRITYGNSRSSVNLGKLNRKALKIKSSHTRMGRFNTDGAVLETEVPFPSSCVQTSEGMSDRTMIKNYTLIMSEDSPKNLEGGASASRQKESLDTRTTETESEQFRSVWTDLRGGIPVLKTISLREFNKPNQGEKVINAKNVRIEDSLEQLEQLNGKVEDTYDSIVESSDDEFALRRIDNDRNLPLSQLRSKVGQSAVPVVDSSDDVRIAQNEQLISVSKLDAAADVIADNEDLFNRPISRVNLFGNTSSVERFFNCKKTIKRKSHTHVSTQPSLKTKQLASLDFKSNPHQQQQQQQRLLMQSNVKEFVKLYEPFPRPTTEIAPPIKENFESGVAKLRSIFEHQGE